MGPTQKTRLAVTKPVLNVLDPITLTWFRFVVAAGFTAADDRLPDFFKKEKLSPHNVVFTVPDEDLDKVFNFG